MSNQRKITSLLKKTAAFLLGGGLLFLMACKTADHQTERQKMLDEIQDMARLTQKETGIPAFSERVMQALAEVPRHEFVPANMRHLAYENHPLPIGEGQTISQPYVVALMTELLKIEPQDKILEVGTGSGYQAAVLAKLARQVFSIEIVENLGKRAKTDLARLGFDNVSVHIGDGYYGWEEHAPFDGIIVTAVADHRPPRLVEQLKAGGRMVIPLGKTPFSEYLTIVEKDAAGNITEKQILPVAFVPLTGQH